MARRVAVYYSFSHEDVAHCFQLRRRLRAWRTAGVLGGPVLEDRAMEWTSGTGRLLDAADVYVLLVTPTFLEYAFAMDREVAWMVRRAQAGEARCVPVLLEACDWMGEDFARFELLPGDGTPLSDRPDVEEAWTEVVDGLLDEVYRVAFGRVYAEEEPGEDRVPDDLAPRQLLDVEIDADFDSFGVSDWHRVTRNLRLLTGDPGLRLLRIREGDGGHLKPQVETSRNGAERLRAVHRKGGLDELLGLHVVRIDRAGELKPPPRRSRPAAHVPRGPHDTAPGDSWDPAAEAVTEPSAPVPERVAFLPDPEPTAVPEATAAPPPIPPPPTPQQAPPPTVEASPAFDAAPDVDEPMDFDDDSDDDDGPGPSRSGLIAALLLVGLLGVGVVAVLAALALLPDETEAPGAAVAAAAPGPPGGVAPAPAAPEPTPTVVEVAAEPTPEPTPEPIATPAPPPPLEPATAPPPEPLLRALRSIGQAPEGGRNELHTQALVDVGRRIRSDPRAWPTHTVRAPARLRFYGDAERRLPFTTGDVGVSYGSTRLTVTLLGRRGPAALVRVEAIEGEPRPALG